MTQRFTTTRRDFIGMVSAAGVAGAVPATALGQGQMPSRPIPGTAETLPVVGLGSSKVVSQVSTDGTGPLAGVLRALVTNGGRVLGVTALGDSLVSAISNAYDAAEKISWPHKFCRNDIGKKGLAYLS